MPAIILILTFGFAIYIFRRDVMRPRKRLEKENEIQTQKIEQLSEELERQKEVELERELSRSDTNKERLTELHKWFKYENELGFVEDGVANKYFDLREEESHARNAGVEIYQAWLKSPYIGK
jgi:hypothetical protein